MKRLLDAGTELVLAIAEMMGETTATLRAGRERRAAPADLLGLDDDDEPGEGGAVLDTPDPPLAREIGFGRWR